MQVSTIKNDSVLAFTRNPIFVRENFQTGQVETGSFSVEMSGAVVYDGRFYPPFAVDLAEIVDAAGGYFREPEDDEDSTLIEIEDSGDFSCREAIIRADYDGMSSEYKFVAIPGGISKQNFRRLVSLGKDIFATRFLNPSGNFFLTTRTAEWRIIVKETELFPLYFLVPTDVNRIDIVEAVTSKTLSYEISDDVPVCALNLDSLRLEFMETHNVIPSVVDVYAGGAYSCRIVIERSDISKERYRLKFRNSLGVFEIIELTGEMSLSPDYDDSDDSTFNRYDSVTHDFYTARERLERKLVVEVATGAKNPDEVRFLMDMLASEEVYLLDVTTTPLKVIPSVDDFSYKMRPSSPEMFTISLEVADSETNIMQDITDGTEGRKPRVFTKVFSKQFN